MQVFYHMNMWVFLCIKTLNLIYELELTLALEPVRFKKVHFNARARSRRFANTYCFDSSAVICASRSASTEFYGCSSGLVGV